MCKLSFIASKASLGPKNAPKLKNNRECTALSLLWPCVHGVSSSQEKSVAPEKREGQASFLLPNVSYSAALGGDRVLDAQLMHLIKN